MSSTCTSCGAPNLPEGEFVCKTCLNQERRTQPEKIDSFQGKYYFLSNFYPAKVTYRGITYKNNEAAFQSMKCPSEARKFANLSASVAKSLGRKIKLRDDWELVKEDIMRDICFAKFFQNEELRMRLMATAPFLLIEGNDWGDKIWGVCGGEGENKLGKILMDLREFFAEDRAKRYTKALQRSISRSQSRRIAICAETLYHDWRKAKGE